MNNYDGWQWKTHQPIIRAVMEFYKPRFVLEIGIGMNSTPVFYEYPTFLVGIENDYEWFLYMKKKYPIQLFHHQLDEGIGIATKLQWLTQKQKDNIYNYYTGITLPIIKPNLLFVDQWTCNRTLSINALKDKFDLIIYHDCQPWESGIPEYEYNLINFEGFNVYFLRNCDNWTGLMIRKEFDKGMKSLRQMIIPHILAFRDKYPDAGIMQFP